MCTRARVCVNLCACVYLVVESDLVLQDVSVGPVWLRPGQGDGVGGSTQLVHYRNGTGNCVWRAACKEFALKGVYMPCDHKGVLLMKVRKKVKVCSAVVCRTSRIQFQ